MMGDRKNNIKKQAAGKPGKTGDCCADRAALEGAVCELEALLTIDERGQMVLPKIFREKAGIRAGERLGLISCAVDGDVCCIAIVRESKMSDAAKGLIGPLLNGLK